MNVLDQEMNPAPIGCPGELFIGGFGLARGYLNNPGLTGEKFVPNPFRKGEKVFKTGDMAAWLPGGILKYLDRVDQQVKIRGYRIEPGEIETVLRKHPNIKDAVVIAKEDGPGNKRLIAYLITSDQTLTKSDYHNWLSDKLPFYMVPAFFEPIDSIPLNPNGKVDITALPEPVSSRPVLNTSYLAPENELEQKISLIWQDILKLDKLGMNDNFFELGGNSILITQMHRRIKEELSSGLSLVEMFKYPTIKLLALNINRSGQSNIYGEVKDEASKRKQLLNQRNEKQKNKLSNIK